MLLVFKINWELSWINASIHCIEERSQLLAVQFMINLHFVLNLWVLNLAWIKFSKIPIIVMWLPYAVTSLQWLFIHYHAFIHISSFLQKCLLYNHHQCLVRVFSIDVIILSFSSELKLNSSTISMQVHVLLLELHVIALEVIAGVHPQHVAVTDHVEATKTAVQMPTVVTLIVSWYSRVMH